MIALFVASLFCFDFSSGNSLKQKSSLSSSSGLKSKKSNNLGPLDDAVVDKEGCYDAYEALVDALKPTTPRKVNEKLKILDDPKTPLETFNEVCLATAADEDCAALLAKLDPEAEAPASAQEKATFTTVCKVENPKKPDNGGGNDDKGDDDIFSIRSNNFLLVMSMILINLYFMI
jgi:hypothetical protein